MKSICIKSNDQNVLTYLLDSIEHLNQEQTCFSTNQFKLYKNVIIHYTGTDTELFITKIATILSYLVIDKYEEIFLNRLISSNYFYFNSNERKKILDICLEILSDEDEFSLENRQQLIFNSFYDYLYTNKQIILYGFINFRLKNYLEFLDEVIDIAVSKFIIEREYLEFISLLKLYIKSHIPSTDFVHLIYKDSKSILLDEDKNIICIDNEMFNSKFLSDISFSSNDYTLNTLLTMLPKKIYIHLIDNNIDEFINTLYLVFENKIEFCNECSICHIYKNSPKRSKRLKEMSLGTEGKNLFKKFLIIVLLGKEYFISVPKDIFLLLS